MFTRRSLRPSPRRRLSFLMTFLLAVTLSSVAPPPIGPRAVAADDPAPCQRVNPGTSQEAYITPCPMGVTVDEAPTWNEGPGGAHPQYWTGAVDWGYTIHAHARPCIGDTNILWEAYEETTVPSLHFVNDPPGPFTLPGDQIDVAIKLQAREASGVYWLHVDAICGNETGGGFILIQFRGNTLGPQQPTNHAPTASCEATQSGEPGQYHFTSEANDPDGDALSYTWDFGDDGPIKHGDNVTHDYTKPGTFPAKVTVSDGRGGTVTPDCPADVPAPTLDLALSLPDKPNGRIGLDETFLVRLSLSASGDGVGDLTGVAFTGDPLRLAPDGHLEIADGPTPPIPATLTLHPGDAPLTFDYHVHVAGVGNANLTTRASATDAAGTSVDSGEVTRDLSASALKVTITPEKNDFELAKDSEGRPVPEDVDITIKVENTSDDEVASVVLGPLDIAAADPNHTYDPFPAEVTGDNDERQLGTIAAHQAKTVTRTVHLTADGRLTLTALATSDAGNAQGEQDLRVDVKTLLRMIIDGHSDLLVNAGSNLTLFGRFTNVSNERTVAITDPMKARNSGNLRGSGMILAADSATDEQPPIPLIGILKPGESREFRVNFYADRPTVADYDAGTFALPEWTEASVDFNVWIRAAVQEDDDTWHAMSTDSACLCKYPESVVVEGGTLGRFEVGIDTSEPSSDGGQVGSSAFGMSIGALQGAQNHLSGLLEFATDIGRFVFNPDFRDETMSKDIKKSELKDSLAYLTEIAVWLPATSEDEIADTVAGNLATAFGAFDREVSGGLARIPASKTEAALRAMTRDYLRHLQGSWRRGDPNEMIDAVMPVGGFVGEQLSDVVVGEAVFEALAHMARVPRYYELAKQNWADAKTIEEMKAKLPSLAQQADLLDANELSKSNFVNLESAYQARRELTLAELGGAENGAGLGRDTIATAQQWTRDNPNMVIVLVPNEPRVAALRDAGLAVGKIENIKPKSMATIERLVFGGREEDLNTIVLRNLNWTTEEVDAQVDALIAAGELVEEDRAVAMQILKKRKDEWKVFTDRGVKNPITGEVTPDRDGIGYLKAYDETGKIPNQFRGEDNGVPFSGPEEMLGFKLEYYKGDELLPPDRIAEADYVSVLQEHPTTHELVKVTGDDDAVFMGPSNGLGLAKDQLEAAYRSVWEVFNHPFTDTWLAAIGSEVKAKLKIFSRYFAVNGEGRAGSAMVAAMNGKFYAVKLDAYLSRFDPIANRAYLKWIGLPQSVDPINPGGWVNAVLRPVGKLTFPATFLRSFLHIPGAATNPDIPPIHSAKRARVLRVNDQGHVESWTPTLGWHLDPTAEAEADAGNVMVAPQTQVEETIHAGSTRVEITSQADMGFAGDWFEVGDTVVLDPGGPNEETATVSGFGSLIFTSPLLHDHAAGELITLLPQNPPETTIASGPTSPTRSRTATFTVTSDQPGATFECRLDGSSWAPCSGAPSYGPLGDGSHVLEARGLAGDQVDASPATWAWLVDTTRPTISIVAPAANAVVTRGQVVTTSFSCADTNGSGVASCSGLGSLDTSSVGRRTFVVTAVDRAGNRAIRTVTYVVEEPRPPCCRLLVSHSPSRTGATTLDGATLKGLLYVFVANDPSIRSVRFSLDGGRYTGTDGHAPWDLVALGPAALPIPAAFLSRGGHRLVATVSLSDGSTKALTATFTIAR